MSEQMPNQSEEEKEVSLFLWLGIFCMPIIFSWVVFRPGYPQNARVAAFVMLVFVLVIILK